MEKRIGDFRIFCGDAYKCIDDFKSENLIVNHIITDPPYNISKKNNLHTLSGGRKGVDFGEWDKGFDLLGWIKPYSELIDKNGSMIIFCSYLFLSDICRELESANMIVKDIIVWQKTNPMPRNVNRRYVQDMEFAVWAVKKGAKWVFNKPIDVPYLRSIYKTSAVHGIEKLGHPTQKSLKLMMEIIKVHTNENDLILDPFAGSGTTLEAAFRVNRKSIGVELDKDNFEMIEKRLEHVLTSV